MTPKRQIDKPKRGARIFYQDDWITLYCGDAREVLPALPSGIAQTCVSSPPYWQLRDYNTAEWIGGDENCAHAPHAWADDPGNVGPAALRANEVKSRRRSGHRCRLCGAVRQDDQIGLEPTPAEYVATMVGIYSEVRRVMRPNGTAWLNIGDSYNGQGESKPSILDNGTLSFRAGGNAINIPGLKKKDLCGIPWRLAFGLQDDDWWLRQDIIWKKSNPMPESVRDRCTKAHEYIFLLSNAETYFCDMVAIEEPVSGTAKSRGDGVNPKSSAYRQPTGWDTSAGGGAHGSFHKDGRRNPKQNASFSAAVSGLVATRNKRSVWEFSTQRFDEAHFATFPPALPETCIKAGTSEAGQCSACGSPHIRILEKVGGEIIKGDSGAKRDRSFKDSRNGIDGSLDGEIPQTITVGWKSVCDCDAGVIPQTVLDPFAGAGTTLIVAKQLGRKSIGIELSEEYCEMIVRRIQAETKC